ncbi:MAG TPA: DUF389 domain-containing protein [Bacteroidia bacterium]|nr:DUF389 domain-containing protein [Bacteroidia bacterium]
MEPLKQTWRFLKWRFGLSHDKNEAEVIIDSISKGIEFRGVNVWVLVFAVFLASIGLNVNSTAVIIGAMLISPLMGPIMGIGLGLGIFDFDLVKSAAKNLAIMVVVSLTASSLYFLLSPLNQAQSELLSRTAPTIWDVLIALFGGLAGIVASASKEKGNVIPGVAIATALMPPLCAAGFGLARGDLLFFSGAFYLFCINAVFISVSTFLVVRLLKLPARSYPDPRIGRRIRNGITVIVLVTILPSMYIAYLTVRKVVFEQRVAEFVRDEFRFDGALVLAQRTDYENNSLDITLIGKRIPQKTLDELKGKRSHYSLADLDIHVHQGLGDTTVPLDVDRIKSQITEDLLSRNEAMLSDKDKTIAALQDELSTYRKNIVPVKDIAEEMKTLNENLLELSIYNTVSFNVAKNESDTVMTALGKFKSRPSRKETERLTTWLKTRTHADTLRFIITN